MGVFNNLGQYMNIPEYSNTGQSSYTVPITGNADADAAALTRAEFLRFQQRAMPAINELVTQAETYLDPQYQGEEITSARENARETSALLRGVADRNISRYGAALTPTQRNQLNMERSRGSVLSQIGAVSNTRQNLRNEGLAALSSAQDIITGNFSAARGAVSQAGLSAAQRQNANRMAKASSKAQMISGGIGLLGTLGFFALGGV